MNHLDQGKFLQRIKYVEGVIVSNVLRGYTDTTWYSKQEKTAVDFVCENLSEK